MIILLIAYTIGWIAGCVVARLLARKDDLEARTRLLEGRVNKLRKDAKQ